MTVITVKVETSRGTDTKYAFPGSTHHVIARVPYVNVTEAYYYTKIIRHGDLNPPTDKFGNYLTYDIIPYSTIQPSVDGTDLHGSFEGWNAIDEKNGSYLARVDLQSGDGANQYYPITSMSSVTLDTLVTTVLNTPGEHAEISLTGYTGNDTLRGSFWHDTLDGGAGADTMIGRKGDDRYWVDNKKDKVVETKGQGHDTVFTKIDYTLGKNVESVSASGTRKFTLTGNSLDNGLEGSSGNDTIKGLDGDDVFAGWGGKDQLYGGTGKDSFLFLTTPQFDKPDTIHDFKPADDTIKIWQNAFTGLFPVYLPSSNFQIPADMFHKSKSGLAHDDSDRILYDTDSGKLYFDTDGTGPAARVHFATLSGHPHITAADIWIL